MKKNKEIKKSPEERLNEIITILDKDSYRMTHKERSKLFAEIFVIGLNNSVKKDG